MAGFEVAVMFFCSG